MLEIAATDAPIPPGDYDAVLVSSAKGVECAPASAQAFQTLPLHAVGAKTAAVARTHGWRTDIVAGSAEAILPLLVLRYTSPVKMLYLAGRDRQPTLEAGLRAAGHAITAVNVYEARAVETLTDDARAAIAAGSIDVALHYSRRSVEIFLRLVEGCGLTPRLGDIAHAALSEDVARPAAGDRLEPGPGEEGPTRRRC